ncbi:MAG TPA: N-acetyl sugar amidotransferase [bacterium]|nr:N-acetyl sugar amidotransferase [bacterium]HNB08430.1 N-acetyl sugar amidotransferase [bacterium]HNH32499.1 N-acetyl sugar amidotransferase [bacterium]HNO90561.1 N-acetyl sugar amidotransferase [bacterium]
MRNKNLEAYYGLPNNVFFCKRCVMSNQRPTSTIEFRHIAGSKKNTMNFDDKGICDACRHAEIKKTIDWKKRESELLRLLEKYRRSDGNYDCLVPGSGGKDSAYQAHILKTKYGMNPLTVTWSPIMYTDYGYQNWKNWIEVGGFDNLLFKQNGKAMKLLTKLSIVNLLHPFQTFILGQKNLAPKVAAKFGISLIFYGENEAEYGNPIADNVSSLRDKSYYSFSNLNEVFLGGVCVPDLISNYGLTLNEIMPFLPATSDELKRCEVEVHYLGYYLKWTPQEVYYYAVENTNFTARPFRTQGTYSKYNSIDDKIDDLHYYTTYIKFGIGRATYDASQEIRNDHITREEGQALVRKFDGEFPDRYFEEIMRYLDINPSDFHMLCDKFRSPHLWAQVNGEWKLRHTVNSDGVDD